MVLFRTLMKVKRAAKDGFCSGVRIADLKVKRFAAGGGRGAILDQVVHNERAAEVIGYTNDLDPALYHIVSKIEEAETIDWSAYAKIKIFYQPTLNAEDFEDVVRTI